MRYLFSIIAMGLLICGQARGANTVFNLHTAFGSNINSGWGTNVLLSVTGGNWTNASGVYECASAQDLSGLTNGMFAALRADGAVVATRYARITAIDDANDLITLSPGAGAGTIPADNESGMSLVVGGALYGPIQPTNSHPFDLFGPHMTNAAGHPPIVYCKGTNFVTNGITMSSNGPIFYEGYTASPGDGGMGYAINGGTSNTAPVPFTLFTVSGAGNTFRYFTWESNAFVSGFVGGLEMVTVTGVDNKLYRCKVKSSHRTGLAASGAGLLTVECEFDSNNLDEANSRAQIEIGEESTHIRPYVHDSFFGTDCVGIEVGAPGEPVVIDGAVVTRNQGHGIWVSGTSSSVTIKNSNITSNAQHGISSAATAALRGIVYVENCIISSNGLFGCANTASPSPRDTPWLINVAFHANGSGETSGVDSGFVTNSITLTGDPFVDWRNGDWSLNNTAGAGAAVRQAGRGSYLGLTVLSAPDVGAIQMTNSAAGAPSSGGSHTFAQ